MISKILSILVGLFSVVRFWIERQKDKIKSRRKAYKDVEKKIDKDKPVDDVQSSIDDLLSGL